MADNRWCVYRHTFPDGKVYIGCTMNQPEKRWNNGYGYYGQAKMFSQIIRYGWTQVKHEIIQDSMSNKEAHALERRLIESYDESMLCNQELYSKGREIIRDFDWKECKVGEFIHFYDLFYDFPPKAYDKIEKQFGNGPMYVDLHFDRIDIRINYMIDKKHIAFIAASAFFPEGGITYYQLKDWLENEALFIPQQYDIGDMETNEILCSLRETREKTA